MGLLVCAPETPERMRWEYHRFEVAKQVDTPIAGRGIDTKPRSVQLSPNPDPGDAVNLRTRAFTKLGAVLAVGVLAAACTPDPEPTPPTASPTPQPSPTSASPTENKLEREQRLAFAGAEAAYRASNATGAKVFGSSSFPRSPAEFRTTAAGEYLALLSDTLKDANEQRWRAVPFTKIVKVRPSGFAAGVVTLRSCEDNRAVRLIYANGKSRPTPVAKVFIQELTVKKFGGVWKVADVDSEITPSLASEECRQ